MGFRLFIFHVITGIAICTGLLFLLPLGPGGVPHLSPGAVEVYGLQCLGEFFPLLNWFWDHLIRLKKLIRTVAESKGKDWQV